ncbi:MAG: acetone carboxylase subunit gamma [Chloroflexota bacterium]
MPAYPDDMIRDLLDRRLPLDQVYRLQSDKDLGRVTQVLALQKVRLGWPEPVLAIIQEHLFVVEKAGGERVTRCDCGTEFGDYRENWKNEALVYERNPRDGEIYVGSHAADPDWQVLREFFCPGCATLLDVEPVPVGYPFIHNFVPEI